MLSEAKHLAPHEERRFFGAAAPQNDGGYGGWAEGEASRAAVPVGRVSIPDLRRLDAPQGACHPGRQRRRAVTTLAGSGSALSRRRKSRIICIEMPCEWAAARALRVMR